MTGTFVVHYSEIALKGNNRPEFVRSLKRNISRSLSGLDHETVQKDGRFIVTSSGEVQEVSSRLGRVFGVSWFAPVTTVQLEYPKILAAVLDTSISSAARSFKIVPRRSDKTFPITSQELATRLGAEVVAKTGKKVDLSNPELPIHVDILRDRALVYCEKLRGPGGLPIGTAGRVIHLFSGGIDSPVAALLLMKRGCIPVYLHFYLAPTPDSAVKSKITGLVKTLSTYGGKSTLVLVPFADYQLATVGAPSELEPSLFRRFMRMTAEALAPRFGASALSTGDSLSQAASQTVWNLGAFDEGCSIPILRPLLTYDKDDIIGLARKLGTLELSLEEYKDCCAMITRHPKTRVRASLISENVREFGLQDVVWKSLERATLLTYNPSGDTVKITPLEESIPKVRIGRSPESSSGK